MPEHPVGEETSRLTGGTAVLAFGPAPRVTVRSVKGISVDGDIKFQIQKKPDPKELLAFYHRQNHKTTHSIEKLRRMVENTPFLVTARRDGNLIGLARGVTDGVWGCVVECKLDPAFQGPACVTRTDGRIEHDSEGIAREMARLVIEALRKSGVERIDVLAYGTEVDFCRELGFKKLAGVVAMELGTDVTVTPTAMSPVGVSA